jgi:hypothetical protein
MGLNKDMAKRLDECFITKAREPEEREFIFRWGGSGIARAAV